MGYKKRKQKATPTRRILILRHAKSSWDDPSLADFDRPLAPRGRRASAVMGQYFKDEHLVPSIVLCSPARRALETWEGIAPFLGIAVPVRTERELYIASPQMLMERLKRLENDISSVLVVGHHTSIDVLAQRLAGEGEPKKLKELKDKFPTAALAVIDVKLENWADLKPGKGKLVGFVGPKELV
jgi:phosphohistidine phosphatase